MIPVEKLGAIYHRARLETRDGQLVAEVWLMPFTIPADVVLWGDRVFVFAPDGACPHGTPPGGTCGECKLEEIEERSPDPNARIAASVVLEELAAVGVKGRPVRVYREGLLTYPVNPETGTLMIGVKDII